MPGVAILTFMIAYGLMLVIVCLPPALIAFQHSRMGPLKWIWAVGSACVIASPWLFRLSQKTPFTPFACGGWMIFIAYRWANEARQIKSQPARFLIMAGAATTLAGASISSLINDSQARAEVRKTHEVEWPLDAKSEHMVAFLLPSGFTRPQLNPTATKDGAIRIEQDGFIAFDLLWPELTVENEINRDEFSRVIDSRVLKVTIEPVAHGVGRDKLTSFRDQSLWMNRGFCAPPEIGKPQRCVWRDVADVKSPLYGLSRRGIDASARIPGITAEEMKKTVFADDVLFPPDGDATPDVIITCSPEEKAYPNPSCKHKFYYGPLNAVVSVQYRRVYLAQWQEIQSALRSMFAKMLAEGRK